MDDQRIRDELNRAIAPAREILAREAMEWAGLLPRQRGKVKVDDLTKEVAAAIQQHSKFGRYRECFFGPKQLMLDPGWGLPENVLRVAVVRGAAAAVDWLHKIFAIETADIRLVMEIHGLRIESPKLLSNGITLAPLSEIPYSPNAAALISHYLAPNSHSLVGIPSIPIVAICEIRNVPGALGSSAQLRKNPQFEEMVRCARAFTLAREYAPVVGASWIDFVDDDLMMTEVGRMWMGPNYEGVLVGRDLPNVDEDDLIWVEKYLRLKPEVRPLCDVAIERLNLGRRRNAPGDKAIEASICLEALLGDRDTQELTYKLALRAALLLGLNLEQKERIRRDVKQLYGLRSRTVHGRAANVKQAQEDATCAANGLAICIDALRKIVELNERLTPSQWELQGGLP